MYAIPPFYFKEVYRMELYQVYYVSSLLFLMAGVMIPVVADNKSRKAKAKRKCGRK